MTLCIDLLCCGSGGSGDGGDGDGLDPCTLTVVVSQIPVSTSRVPHNVILASTISTLY